MDDIYSPHSVSLNKYSRQVYALGQDPVAFLRRLRVGIVGVNGAGVEVAKNLILAGCDTLFLHDPTPLKVEDIGVNPFVTEENIGLPRHQAPLKNLQQLNKDATVTIWDTSSSLTSSSPSSSSPSRSSPFPPPSSISELGIDVVVLCVVCAGTTEMYTFQNSCRGLGVPVVMGLSFGVIGCVFCDFGDGFVVQNPKGEEKKSSVFVSLRMKGEEEKEGEEDEGCFSCVIVDQKGEFASGMHVRMCNLEVKKENEDENKPTTTTTKTQALKQMATYLDSQTFTITHTSKSHLLLTPSSPPPSHLPPLLPYLLRGTLLESPPPQPIIFQPLEKAVVVSNTYPTNRSSSNKVVLVAVQALWGFVEAWGRLPRYGDVEDMKAFVKIAQEINQKKSEIELEEEEEEIFWEVLFDDNYDYQPHHQQPTLYETTSLFAEIEVGPLSGIIGGAVVQEVIKLSRHFLPLDQWLCFEYSELVKGGEEGEGEGGRGVKVERGEGGEAKGVAMPWKGNGEEKEIPKRYGYLVKLIGRDLFDSISKKKIFLVGCGALGCEYLKIFSLLGLGTGKGGKEGNEEGGVITVTDNDCIELSNLCRQFLFREGDIGRGKSEVGSREIRKGNKRMNIKDYGLRVGGGGQGGEVFGWKFWEELDLVVTALDNLEARLHIDSQCILHHLPLIESGTKGLQASSNVSLPFSTSPFSSQIGRGRGGRGARGGEGKEFESCTLKYYPFKIEHTAAWAGPEGLLSTLFVAPFECLQKMQKGGKEMDGKEGGGDQRRMEEVRVLLEALKMIHAPSSPLSPFQICVSLAIRVFKYEFYERINELIINFPAGSSCWCPPVCFPRVVKLDVEVERQFGFLFCCANLYALGLGISRNDNKNEVKQIIQSCLKHGPLFPSPKIVSLPPPPSLSHTTPSPSPATLLPTTSSPPSPLSPSVTSLLSSLPSHALSPLSPLIFEKDDDDNFQIDFITFSANLRAENYHICPSLSWFSAKMTLGKVIPAVGTTTSVICSLNGLELLKIYLLEGRGEAKSLSQTQNQVQRQPQWNHKHFYNSQINLANHFFSTFYHPPPSLPLPPSYNPELDSTSFPLHPNHTLWEHFVFSPPPPSPSSSSTSSPPPSFTLEEFLELFSGTFSGVTPMSVARFGEKQKPLFTNYAITKKEREKFKERRGRGVREVWEEDYGREGAKGEQPLVLSVVGEREGEEEGMVLVEPVILYC